MTRLFKPPTVEEVRAYAASRGYPDFDAQKFVDYYTVNDWRDGHNQPVKNWKQKFIGVWEAKLKGNGKTTKKTKLFPIPGKMCSTRGCGMPAVYKQGGEYDFYYCCRHMPEKVKELYE